MRSVLLRVVVVVVLCAHALSDADWKRSNAMRYCGRHLSDIFQVVCQGRYNTLVVKKSRGQTISAGENDVIMDPEMEEGGGWQLNSVLGDLPLPFRPKSAARALSPRVFRRVLRGAHDECCAKSCTIQEIRTYCAEN